MEIGAAQLCAPGETVCGDDHVVVDAGDVVLIAVCDGLGHGADAHVAAAAASATIRAHAHLDLLSLADRVDRQLRATRGAAVTFAKIRHAAGAMQCGGVGNVGLVTASRTPIRPLTTPGVLGSRFRKMNVYQYALSHGDRVVLFSDGISQRLCLAEFGHLRAQAAADAIMARHKSAHDDATCVVVDY